MRCQSQMMIYNFHILNMRAIKLPKQVHMVTKSSLNINLLNPPHPVALCLKANHMVHLYLMSHHAHLQG